MPSFLEREKKRIIELTKQLCKKEGHEETHGPAFPATIITEIEDNAWEHEGKPRILTSSKVNKKTHPKSILSLNH